MIGVHIIAEWLAAFIESILYFKIVSVIFETQFSKKKQIKFGLFLSAFIAIGIVMLNMVDLSISLPTLGYAAISYTLGGKILYRGRFLEFLFIANGYGDSFPNDKIRNDICYRNCTIKFWDRKDYLYCIYQISRMSVCMLILCDY